MMMNQYSIIQQQLLARSKETRICFSRPAKLPAGKKICEKIYFPPNYKFNPDGTIKKSSKLQQAIKRKNFNYSANKKLSKIIKSDDEIINGIEKISKSIGQVFLCQFTERQYYISYASGILLTGSNPSEILVLTVYHLLKDLAKKSEFIFIFSPYIQNYYYRIKDHANTIFSTMIAPKQAINDF